MATELHCAYCFETLVADLEERPALEFGKVDYLWSLYAERKEVLPEGEGGRDGADGRGLEGNGGEGMMDGVIGKEDVDEEQEEEMVASKTKPHSLQLPSISRLQALSPTSGSSSSSTPSSLSTTSSSAALGGNSKSSSSSSFFSFGRSKQPSPAAPATPKEEEHPLFVTWNTVSPRTGNKSLRGCIGTFDPKELSVGLRSYAITAAFDDTRFSPISMSELPSLSTSVTLLTSFTACAHPLDWDLDTHGIRISFQHHGKRYGATYLPDVAVEQGWNKEETIVSLMRKAGWAGRSRDWRDVKGLTVVRYQGKKCSLGYAEWKAWRDWVDER